MRFVSLALNHLDLRGPHFQATLKELFATILVTKPEGCSLLRDSFALTPSGSLHKIHMWGTRLTWTAQREHASQTVRGMQSFFDSDAFMKPLDGGEVVRLLFQMGASLLW